MSNFWESVRAVAIAVVFLAGGFLPANAQAQSDQSADVLEPLIRSGAIAGAVTLVANREAVLDVDAIGWANIEHQQPLRTDAMFWIASQTKPMTATALMMLVDRGQVELDADVEKYLPEFQGRWVIAEKDDSHQLLKRPARAVSVRDILSHMSGLPYTVATEQPVQDGLKLALRVRSYTMIPLETEPGVAYRYSNAGINTAARIIEVVSGRLYETFLQEELFDPLGMTETTFWPTEAQAARIATAYQPNKARDGLEATAITQLTYPLTDRVQRYPLPAGGLFSTAGDVARFCQMIANGGEWAGKKILSPVAVEEMTSRQTPPTVDVPYGLGWQISHDGYGHGGAYSTNMSVLKDQGLVTVYLVQHAGFPLNGKEGLDLFRRAAKEKFAK